MTDRDSLRDALRGRLPELRDFGQLIYPRERDLDIVMEAVEPLLTEVEGLRAVHLSIREYLDQPTFTADRHSSVRAAFVRDDILYRLDAEAAAGSSNDALWTEDEIDRGRALYEADTTNRRLQKIVTKWHDLDESRRDPWIALADYAHRAARTSEEQNRG